MTNEALKHIQHVALDMDGTIYRGGTLFEFTLPFLSILDTLGIGRTFLTNNSSKSVRDYLTRLRSLGILVEPAQMQTSTMCALDYLHRELPGVKTLYVLGTASLCEEFREAGFTVVSGEKEPEAVVVGFDTGLPYDRLCKAAWWVNAGKPYIATHPDRVCPTDQPTVLVDCGAVCSCIEAATGRKPDAVLGKPDPWMLRGILDRHGLQPSQLAMVGDRLYTDIAMACAAGCVGVLVLTGEASEADVIGASAQPGIVVPSVRELGDMLAGAGARGAKQ